MPAPRGQQSPASAFSAVRPSRRALVKGGLVTLALAASPRGLGLPAAAAEAMPAKIVIGTVPANTEVTAYLGAIDCFKESGLTVELLHGADAPAVMEALVGGSIPLADIGLDAAIIATARGLPLLHPALGAVGTPQRPLSRIMVREDSPIVEVPQLKGRKLALTRHGSLEELGLAALKKTHGLARDEIEVVLLPPADQPQALARGQVDAIYAVPPVDTIAERRFKARTLINTADFIPYIGCGTLAMRRDFVDAYPGAARKAMTAWLRFCRWIDDHAEAAHQASGAALNLDQDLRASVRLPYFARNGLPVMPNLWHVYEMLAQGKALETAVDPTRLFEETVIEPTRRITLPALDALGWDKDAVVQDMLRASYPLLAKPPEDYYAEWEKKLLSI
jgi:ABC-type nitrate/sulfonate/bicarbonate transport system substrate-binding protein